VFCRNNCQFCSVLPFCSALPIQYTPPICPDAPNVAIILDFGVWGDIADVITHDKFCVDRFRGFRVLTPPIFPFFIGLAGRPYNSVSTTVLHCERVLDRCHTCDFVARQSRQCDMAWHVTKSRTRATKSREKIASVTSVFESRDSLFTKQIFVGRVWRLLRCAVYMIA